MIQPSAQVTTWIKICGMTTPVAVAAALDAGVDAIGFVFAESPRQLTPAAAARLAAPARGRAICTAVTRHPTQQSIDEILAVFQPDMLQTDADDLRALRLPQELRLLPVFRRWQDDERQLPTATARHGPPRLLFEGLSSSRVNRSWCWRAA
jgi:phosphoribosylanthranilate isomerase